MTILGRAKHFLSSPTKESISCTTKAINAAAEEVMSLSSYEQQKVNCVVPLWYLMKGVNDFAADHENDSKTFLPAR